MVATNKCFSFINFYDCFILFKFFGEKQIIKHKAETVLPCSTHCLRKLNCISRKTACKGGRQTRVTLAGQNCSDFTRLISFWEL